MLTSGSTMNTASNTAVSAPVPTGATTGNIVVTVNGNSSPVYPFMVTPAPQSPGVHFIQGDYVATDSVPSSAMVAFPIAQTAGNLNVVVVGWRGAYNVSVTDTASNTYVLAVGPTQVSPWRQSIYYAKNIAGATSNSVTVTFTSQTQAPISQIAADGRRDCNKDVTNLSKQSLEPFFICVHLRPSASCFCCEQIPGTQIIV